MTNLFSPRAPRGATNDVKPKNPQLGSRTTLGDCAESHRSVQGKATELHPFGAANREVPVIGQGPGTSSDGDRAAAIGALRAMTALTVPDAKIAAVHESALDPARTRPTAGPLSSFIGVNLRRGGDGSVLQRHHSDWTRLGRERKRQCFDWKSFGIEE